jgi:hypothetical protein
MSENRPWYLEPETFVAVAALIVSFSALGVGVYEASLQRTHDRAEVWPNLEVGTFTTGEGAKVIVDNTGLGPAIVESVAAMVDDTAKHTWRGVFRALLGDSARNFGNTSLFDHGVRPGDRVELLTLPASSLPTPFWPQIGRVTLRVCYRSVFEERWMVEARLGTANRRVKVTKCPAQVAGDDF